MPIARDLRCWLLAALFALPLASLADEAEEDETIVRGLVGMMEGVFALSPELELDPEVRGAAEAMAAAHRTRLPALLKQWVAEERRLMPAPGDGARRATAVSARVANQLALWRLLSAGAAHDAAWAALLEHPRLCDKASKARSYFGMLVSTWQLAQGEQRRALLDGERILLERWADVPASVPARPTVAETRQPWREGRGQRRMPMPPSVVAALLDHPDLERQSGPRTCLVMQWRYRERRAAGPDKAEAALLAARYDWMPTVGDWYAPDKPPPGAASDYPPVAARWDVTGAVSVDVTFDASERRHARIASRQIAVTGIRGVRPVAFETLLDEASLQRAETLKPRPGSHRLRAQFDWKLE